MSGKPRRLIEEEEAEAREGRNAVSQYQPGFSARAQDYCLLGATNDELATFFNVSVQSIEAWIVEIPRFAKAIRLGREGADSRVARALYRRAVGMTVKKEKAFNVAGTLQTIVVKEELPPDTAAAQTWLGNRAKTKWRTSQSGGEPISSFDLAALVSGVVQLEKQRQAALGDDAKPVQVTVEKDDAEPKG